MVHSPGVGTLQLGLARLSLWSPLAGGAREMKAAGRLPRCSDCQRCTAHRAATEGWKQPDLTFSPQFTQTLPDWARRHTETFLASIMHELCRLDRDTALVAGGGLRVAGGGVGI